MMWRWIGGFALAASLASTAAFAGTLEDIKARGTLSCGVETNRAGISVVADGKGQGFATDLCKALAAAVIGRVDAVGFVNVTAADAFAALQAEDVDVLLLPLPWRFNDEIEQGVMMVQPLLRHKSGDVFGPVVRHGDDGWFSLVRWTVFALQAGEVANTLDAGAISLSPTWASDAVAAAGNYEAIVARHKPVLDAGGMDVLPKISGPQF